MSAASRLTGPGSPFELTHSTSDGESLRRFKHGPQTLNDIYQRFTQAPQRQFAICGSSSASYGDVAHQAANAAAALAHGFGVRAGTRVAIMLGNSPEWLTAFVAVTSLGAAAVLIPELEDAHQLRQVLETARCAVLIANRELVGELADAGCDIPAIVADADELACARHGGVSLAEMAAGMMSCLPRTAIDPEQEAVIAFTSGSTGSPKGIVLSHRCLTSGLMNMLLGRALSALRGAKHSTSGRPSPAQSLPVSLLAAPFSYIAGYAHVLLMAYLGGTIITLPKWDAGSAVEVLAKEDVHALAGATPVMMRELLGVKHGKERLRRLRSVGLHGVALDRALLEELLLTLPGTAITTGYGMTETSGSVCVATGQDLLDRPGTVGPVLPSVDLKLVRHDSDWQAATGVGEIWLRGAMVMQGYCGQPEGTREVLQDGWLRSGDLGRLDDEGLLYVLDRSQDVISIGTEHISCVLMEQALLRIDALAQAAVFGIADARHDEQFIVAAVPRQHRMVDTRLLRSHLCRISTAAASACQILIIDHMPLTPSGKADRRKLRRLALAAAASGNDGAV